MGYHDLLLQSPQEYRTPLVWRLPGSGPEGKVALYNGAAASLGMEVRANGGQHVLLVIGRHARNSDAGSVISAALFDSGISYDVFSDIPAEPHYEDIVPRLQETFRKETYDMVVGVGGGSVMDVAKLAAHASDGKLEEKLANQDFTKTPLPLFLLPTTSGTGSEVSPYAVLTVQGKKVFYGSPNLLPITALVDPLLTITAPKYVTVATAFDAMTHALEGAMARPTPYSEALAVESTAQILEYLPAAAANGTDLEARYHLSMASVMGMMSYATGGGLYAHSISYILTLEKNQPHGVGCGFALPYTMMMNWAYISALLQKLSARCFGDAKDGNRVLQRIQEMFVSLGLPASLREFGYEEAELPRLAEKLLSQYGRKNNPRQLSQEDAVTLFDVMYRGQLQEF